VQLKASNLKCSLVVSGDALDHISHHYGANFIKLAQGCVSLVCARMSPKQKTVLVELVQKYDSDKVVLTVGDGANDIGMLTTANVGVAICGVEGR
jgi:P-type E1-E2 ATPase